jgi:hypothetical protein
MEPTPTMIKGQNVTANNVVRQNSKGDARRMCMPINAVPKIAPAKRAPYNKNKNNKNSWITSLTMKAKCLRKALADEKKDQDAKGATEG